MIDLVGLHVGRSFESILLFFVVFKQKAPNSCPNPVSVLPRLECCVAQPRDPIGSQLTKCE